jgi:hypothetical protein
MTTLLKWACSFAECILIQAILLRFTGDKYIWFIGGTVFVAVNAAIWKLF